MRKRSNLIRQVIGILLLLASLIMLIKPEFDDLSTDYQAEIVRESMEAVREIPLYQPSTELNESGESSEENVVIGYEEDPVLSELKGYNKMLTDPEYQKNQIEYMRSSGLWDEETVFGTIEIPSIQVDLPLFIGTTDKNLASGAAVLEGTSFPVGGTGKNSVISGHRGWRGASFFKEIEEVDYGDEIIITNRWETLTYHVVGMSIIDPTEIPPLMIREGEDLITLVTCHPYRSPRNMRYVVYAEREEESQGVFAPSENGIIAETEETNTIMTSRDYEAEKTEMLDVYGSSSDEILWETWLRRGAVAVLVIGGILLVIREKHE